MFLKSQLMFIYVQTALHAGAGGGLGAVDLPIQRERATGYPIVQASGLKGALRSEAYMLPAFLTRETSLKTQIKTHLIQSGKSDADAEREAGKRARRQTAQELGLEAIFGPDTDDAAEHAGALATSDARILLFPVRSLKGVFVWVTSLEVLQRWFREATLAKIQNLPALPASAPTATKGEIPCYVSGNDVTVDGTLEASADNPTTRENVKQVVLEEFTYTVRQGDPTAEVVSKLAKWLADNALPNSLDTYWGNQLCSKLVVLPDDEFRDFLTHSTEILTRVRLETDSKTVAQGALWTEEHLPADSLLYAPVHATRLRVESSRAPANLRSQTPEQEATNVLNWVTTNVPTQFQLGGDETVGRGIVGIRWSGGGTQ